MKLAHLTLLFALLGGCAMPATTVRAGTNRPSLAVAGAPRGTVLFVDGNRIGAASDYDGQAAVLAVEPGAHEVEIRDEAGRVLHREKVFVESELKTVEVRL